MVKACRKNRSKRQTLHKKYKIIKKVKEHHRKLRKEKKENPKKFRHKDPGIPNSLPFKEEVIKHVADTKAKFEEIRKNQFLASLKARNQPQNVGNSNDIKLSKKGDLNQMGEFRKVVHEADVVLEVVDARDPIGTRCLLAEQEVISAKKKLVIILNKIDLVPKENVKAWLQYLRQSYVTLPFKANTQQQNLNLGRKKAPWAQNFNTQGKAYKCNLGVGVDGLLALLGNYARGVGEGGRLVVGVVGLPNTGKSAIVNTLKRKKVAISSIIPGQTRQAQLFQIDKKLYLYDSPGLVVTSAENCADACDLVLKNCIKPETLPDPVPAAEAILRRVPKKQLIIRYGIGDYASVTDFLVQLAIKRGKLKKRGVPNTRAVAQRLIQDWILGNITYHTSPPTESDDSEDSVRNHFNPSALPATENGLDDVKVQSVHDDTTLATVISRDMSDTQFCPDAVLKTGEPIKISTLSHGFSTGDEIDMDHDGEDSEDYSEGDDEEESDVSSEDDDEDEEGSESEEEDE